MLRLSTSRLLVILFIASILFLMGNSPPPWYACQGLKEGDPCQYGYGCSRNQVCTRHSGCTDDTGSEVDECLWCESR
jgi:hypothetical protein